MQPWIWANGYGIRYKAILQRLQPVSVLYRYGVLVLLPGRVSSWQAVKYMPADLTDPESRAQKALQYLRRYAVHRASGRQGSETKHFGNVSLLYLIVYALPEQSRYVGRPRPDWS